MPALPAPPIKRSRWMMSLPPMRLALLICSLCALHVRAARADERLDFFEKRIRPLLVEHCFKCHSSDSAKIQGGLRLDRRADALAGGDSGPAIVPGKPDDSLLIKAVSYSGSVSEMPPDRKLPENLLADLRRWIADGAVYPSDSGPSAPKPQTVDLEAGRRFWSFLPAHTSTPPAVRDRGWPRNSLDSFILQRLELQELGAAPAADRRSLLRRLSFDVRGLPPTYEELAEFVSDQEPDALERRIDRYLASPAYGERWARHWLDVARYAEDNPTSEATCKPPRFPWRYRDWVIDAFNADLSYDQFVRRQLAADLIDVPSDQIAALGFLGLSPVYHKEPKLSAEVITVIVADEWDERLDTITRGFLGLTVACARCHDHKYDPIRTEDYYALAGVMASTQLVEWPLEPTNVDVATQLTEVQRQIVDTELRFDYAKKMRDTAKREGRDPAVFVQDAEREEQKLKDLKATQLYNGPIANAARDAGLWIDGQDPSWTLLDFRPGAGRDLPVFRRGNPATPGSIVPRGFLAVLSSSDRSSVAESNRSASGRRELADSMVTDAASLTARVIVNRVWSWRFGRGLVATPSNFGRLGDAPSHPELLDDLTARFIASGWSLKWLHRELLGSSTWQQTSNASARLREVDPENRWLGRMTRRRLEPEPWRDALLGVSEQLDRTQRGPSQNLDDPKSRRRAVYGTISRQKPSDILRLFDFPDAKSHCETRLATTTPLQQLFLLNSPLIQNYAREAATLVTSRGAMAPSEVVREMYRQILARDPTEAETAAAIALVRRADEAIQNDDWTLLAHSLLATNEFLYVD